MRSILAGVAALASLTLAAPALADSIAGTCRALNASSNAGCRIERASTGGGWSLTTSVLVGGGRKRDVATLERRFCEAARARGVEAEVTRLNRIDGRLDGAAKQSWRCTAPAVSAGPDTSR